jgi:GT2 family glycosyltransferase
LCLPAPHPRIYEDPLGPEAELGLASALKSLADTCQLGQIVSILDLPFWRAAAQTLPGSTLIYDCMDYHAGFSTNAPAMLEEEERLLQDADLVITTSARLSEKLAEVTPNRLIRNAGEVEFFRAGPPRLHYRSDRPVVGYFGAIADWFDIELVTAAAQTYAGWDFVLVGSTYQCDTKRAERLANVHFIGEVPYADLPGYLHAFDVCLIPFKETELTRCTNPVKVYEYLAAGKPVVATALPEVQLIAEQLHVAQDRGEFIQALATAMEESRDKALAESRAQWARQHDWRARIRELNEALRGLFPKVSVIVLTYDNLAFTRACLDSLERYTHYPDWELILVDNASRDGSVEFLQDYAARRKRVRLLLNTENRGFAAGNNQGLAAATGEVLILLNNDTYVTPGWMTGLVRHLRRRPELGMVGPVTNNIGNEARIDISYRNMEEMREAAFAYTRAHARELFYNDTVAFFCAAMTRQAYAAVGPLEEAFGQGFFEDDDYCNRLRGKGYKVAIAEDVFVHHHLSASFGQLEEAERRALFERNKVIYEQKWGAWIPHKYRD